MNTFKMSLRDAAKADKHRRIFEAAREQFATVGFEDSTIRGIAAAAGVGVGTVMVYGETKQALLHAVWREEVMPIVHAAVADAEGRPFEDALAALFFPLLRAYAAQPQLARVVVKELPWLDGSVAAAHAPELALFLGAIVQTVATAQAAGTLRAELDPVETAGVLFALYYASCLRLLTPFGTPDPAQVEQHLGAALHLVLHGLRPTRSTP